MAKTDSTPNQTFPDPAFPGKPRRPLSVIRDELADVKAKREALHRVAEGEWQSFRERHEQWHQAVQRGAQAARTPPGVKVNPFLQPIRPEEPRPDAEMVMHQEVDHSLHLYEASLHNELNTYTKIEMGDSDRESLFLRTGLTLEKLRELSPPPPEPPGGWEEENRKRREALAKAGIVFKVPALAV